MRKHISNQSERGIKQFWKSDHLSIILFSVNGRDWTSLTNRGVNLVPFPIKLLPVFSLCLHRLLWQLQLQRLADSISQGTPCTPDWHWDKLQLHPPTLHRASSDLTGWIVLRVAECPVCWPENWVHTLCFAVYEHILTLAGATWDNNWNCVGEKEAHDVGGMHLQSKCKRNDSDNSCNLSSGLVG